RLARPKPPVRQRAVAGARHAGVEITLHELVQRQRPGSRERRPDQRLEERRELRRTGRAEVVPDDGRHQHHQHDPRLAELQGITDPAGEHGDRPGAAGGSHAGTSRRKPMGAGWILRRRPRRAAWSVSATHVARRAAPTARCAVVGTTVRRVQITDAPRLIWTSTSVAARTAARVCSGRWRSTWTTVAPTARMTATAPTRCAKWMVTAGVARGGNTRPNASGKSGMARPAPMWRMRAPRTSCPKTTAVVVPARSTSADSSEAVLPGGVAHPGPVTIASTTVRQKNACARHAWVTDTASGSL